MSDNRAADIRLGVTPTWRVVRAVAGVTFREILGDKVLYNIILCAGLLMGASFLASRIMVMRQDRVVMDFGLSAINISCAMVAGLTGAGMVSREIERRTMLVALARPVSRHQFVLGKFAGLAAILLLNWTLLSVVYLAVLWASSSDFAAVSTTTLGVALLLLYFQSLILLGVSVLFSSFSTTSLSVILTVGCYLCGNNVSQIRQIAARTGVPAGRAALTAASFLLPDLEHFNLGNKVTYGIPVEAVFTGTAILYAVVYSGVTLILAGILIRSRES